MAVAVEITFPGATLEQYDQVIQEMGFTPGGAGAPGGLFHWVTTTDDGIRVTDVWQSKELFEQFAQEQIGPSMHAAGIEAEPQIRFFEVHNHLTAG